MAADGAKTELLLLKPSKEPLSTYLGISFGIFLGFLPKSYMSFISSIQSRNRSLSLKLFQAEEKLKQMQSRRKEDSKANAKVVEIFASHRNGWQQEEKKLLHQIDLSAEEIVHLKTKIGDLETSASELRICIEKLQRELDERDQMINFMSRKTVEDEDDDFCLRTGETENEAEIRAYSWRMAKSEKESEIRGYGSQSRGVFGRNEDDNGEFGDYCTDFSEIGKIRVSKGLDPVPEVCYLERSEENDEMSVLCREQNVFSRDFLSPASKTWTERSGTWQDIQYEPHETLYHMKHFVARESPWKVDGKSTGVPSKLKLLEQELLNLERIGNGELSKVPSLMRKQAKRYQALSGKIDDLCRRMQASDPCEPTLSSELRTQRQTEFLVETFRLQQRALETGQKLTALQAETVKSYVSEDFGGQGKLSTRRFLDSIRNNFKEIQRNLEIWLARIMGDLEGILARDGASRVREYYISRYPFIQ
ncbi:ribonuclease P protein subunit P38-like protein isoform X2 [Tasmannia lanceolata]|uniref:ribonuclease P protein subunit P38-like protein isoform X2 n=1 Tax=Tasmannia lanceolata TaxID=3420 RepID=UPI004062A08E